MNRNVQTTYLFTFFNATARSILSQQLLSAYLLLLTHANAPMGLVRGLQGLSEMLLSLPAAWVADRTRRDSCLLLASALGAVAIFLTAWGLRHDSVGLLDAAFVGWGLFAALSTPATEALFIDSLVAGERAAPIMHKINLTTLAAACGPLLSILLFHYWGNAWQLGVVKSVLYCGLGLAGVALVVLFRFSDDHALPASTATARGGGGGANQRHASSAQLSPLTRATIKKTALDEESNAPVEHVLLLSRRASLPGSEYDLFDHSPLTPSFPLQSWRPRRSPSETWQATPSTPLMLRSPVLVGTELMPMEMELGHDGDQQRVKFASNVLPLGTLREQLSQQHDEQGEGYDSDDDDDSIAPGDLQPWPPQAPSTWWRRWWPTLTARHVPYLLFLSDVITFHGSGMTVNLFAVFFIQEFHVQPIQLNVIHLVQTVLIIALSWFVQRLASRSRVPLRIVVVVRALGIACLVAMAFVDHLAAQIVLFEMRVALMRAPDPVIRAVLMDHVPPHLRARWNALDSVVWFVFAESAILGGFVVDAYGYRICFLVASVVYTLGLLVDALVVPLVTTTAAPRTSSKRSIGSPAPAIV